MSSPTRLRFWHRTLEMCLHLKLRGIMERWLDSRSSSSSGVERKRHHSSTRRVNIYHHLIKDDYLHLKGGGRDSGCVASVSKERKWNPSPPSAVCELGLDRQVRALSFNPCESCYLYLRGCLD